MIKLLRARALIFSVLVAAFLTTFSLFAAGESKATYREVEKACKAAPAGDILWDEIPHRLVHILSFP